MDLPLWPWQAVLGADLPIETPDGPVTLTCRRARRVDDGCASAAAAAAPGRQPRPLHAVARILVPERPSAEERTAYEALKRMASTPADRPAGG